MTISIQPGPDKPRICVCICTYKRPRLLGELLRTLDRQETGSIFDYAIVVVDNDRAESGRQIAESEAVRSRTSIRYFVEPEQNIARARNKAIANAKGDFLAFIDDDELPEPRWLLQLYKALTLFEIAGVLGPVLPSYEAPPPRWVLNGRFFERPTYFSGYFLHWEHTRTGNCLLRREIFEGSGPWFLPKFGSGGEDRDFFKRMSARGHVFVWCKEAPLYEAVPPERWKKRILIKRALLRGKMTYNSRKQKPWDVIGSAGAAFFFSITLPFLYVLSPVFGFDVFMKTLIRDCDHLGKVFALFGINFVKTKYVA